MSQSIWDTARNGTIALIATIASFIVGFIPGLSWAGGILSFGAIVFACISLYKKEKSKWPAIVSLIVGFIGVIIFFVVLFLLAIVFGAALLS